MANMQAAQVRTPGSLEVVQVPVPEPAAGQVRIRVQACGVCHSDAFVYHAAFPGLTLPRIPGHEVAGIVDQLGPGVEGWSVGQRVGVGWHGGHCGRCQSCRRGDFVTCSKQQICGISYDGGYAEFMVAPIEALAAVPADLDAVAAGPLLCAGITVFNALRNSGARPPQLVAVLGVGGLGHLAIQFSAKMGYRTVALARGGDKEGLARQLGAHHYIDTSRQDPADVLSAMGGARVVLATATNSAAMNAVVGGLSVDGRLIVLGVDAQPLSISPLALIGPRRSVQGWPSGTPVESEDTLTFSALTGVRAMVETYPLSRAPEAFSRMLSGAARFRVVITPDH